MLIIMHRGASMVAPENTIAALQRAGLAGAKWVESDVCLSSDNNLVIFHDDTLARTAQVKGRLQDFCLDSLAQLDVGSWFSAEFTNERIPTVPQWLAVAANLDINLNLEIKGKFNYKLCVDLLLQSISSNWPQRLPHPLLSSFDIDILSYLATRKNYNFNFGLNLELPLNHYPEFVYDERCVSIHFDINVITKKIICDTKSLGKKVYVYTVNDLAVAKRLAAMGVDAIFTDNLELLTEF